MCSSTLRLSWLASSPIAGRSVAGNAAIFEGKAEVFLPTNHRVAKLFLAATGYRIGDTSLHAFSLQPFCKLSRDERFEVHLFHFRIGLG